MLKGVSITLNSELCKHFMNTMIGGSKSVRKGDKVSSRDIFML